MRNVSILGYLLPIRYSLLRESSEAVSREINLSSCRREKKGSSGVQKNPSSKEGSGQETWLGLSFCLFFSFSLSLSLRLRRRSFGFRFGLLTGISCFVLGMEELAIFASVTFSFLEKLAGWRVKEVTLLTFTAFSFQVEWANFAILLPARGGTPKRFPVGGRSAPTTTRGTLSLSPSGRTAAIRSP